MDLFDIVIRILGISAGITGLISTQVKDPLKFRMFLLIPTALWAGQAYLLNQVAAAAIIAWGGVRIGFSAFILEKTLRVRFVWASLFVALGQVLFILTYNGQAASFYSLAAFSIATFAYFCLENKPLRACMVLTCALYVIFGILSTSYEIALLNFVGGLGHLRTWHKLRKGADKSKKPEV